MLSFLWIHKFLRAVPAVARALLLFLEMLLSGGALLLFELLLELFLQLLVLFVLFVDDVVLGLGNNLLRELAILKALNRCRDLVRSLDGVLDLALLLEILLHLVPPIKLLQLLMRLLPRQNIFALLLVKLFLCVHQLFLIVVDYALGASGDGGDFLVRLLLLDFLVNLFELLLLFFS